jgi:peroxiredoxin
MNNFWFLAIALLWVALPGAFWLGWQLLRQNGRILLRLDELEKRLNEIEFGDESEPEGLPLDSVAPEFELPDLDGKTHKLADYRGQSLLLIFFNPECGFCREMAGKLKEKTGTGLAATAQQRVEKQKTEVQPYPAVLLISTGEAQANRKFFDEHPVGCAVLVQKDMEVGSAYKANGTPTGYLISGAGRIASELTIGAEALLALADGSPHPLLLSHRVGEGGQQPGEGDRADRFSDRSLARSKIKRDGLKAGTMAPGFRLPRLDGRGELGLENLRGRKTLLVFSSPGCGPCNTLAPELEKFHRQHSGTEVVMISKGEPKENRSKVKEHGLTFPVVLQQQWEISRRYAMFATPVAYLIDEKGVIAHDVAVGSDAILDLLGKANHSIEKTSQV